MVNLCWFKEFECDFDTGSIKDVLTEKVTYSKSKVITYLKKGKKIASCPRPLKDPVTGKVVENNFAVMSDEEYIWVDILPDLIERYNINLPEDFVKKATK